MAGGQGEADEDAWGGGVEPGVGAVDRRVSRRFERILGWALGCPRGPLSWEGLGSAGFGFVRVAWRSPAGLLPAGLLRGVISGAGDAASSSVPELDAGAFEGAVD